MRVHSCMFHLKIPCTYISVYWNKPFWCSVTKITSTCTPEIAFGFFFNSSRKRNSMLIYLFCIVISRLILFTIAFKAHTNDFILPSRLCWLRFYLKKIKSILIIQIKCFTFCVFIFIFCYFEFFFVFFFSLFSRVSKSKWTMPVTF